MALQTFEREAESSIPNTISSSEIFSIVQQISSKINESHIQEVPEVIKGLTTNENQLIVDLLSIALEKHHHILMNPDRVLNLLTQIALSANVVARNRTLNPENPAPSTETSPGVYMIHNEPPSYVRVIKKGACGYTFSKSLINWAHLSHPNILPVYRALLEGENGPIFLVSPLLNERKIVDHAKTLTQVGRMPLIYDVIDGLYYLHQLDIVHGALNPECVLISDNGKASITDLDSASQTFAARYSAPEVLDNEDAGPTRAADVWAFGCLCYEVLSGNVPFCQYLQEAKVSLAVVKGKRPTRPGQEGVKGEEIGDITWRPVSACWEFEIEDRPTSSKLRDAFTSMNLQDDRPVSSPFLLPGKAEIPPIDLESARSLLNQFFGSDESLPPPSQIPENLREPLLGLADNFPKVKAVAVAAKKLSPDDTQTLLDALDLVYEENPSFVETWHTGRKLMETVMTSTHVYPQRYKLRRIRYDPSPIAEDTSVKVYKGCDLDVCVNVITEPRYDLFEYLPVWAHSSHPNVLPFYGMFNEAVNEISRFCIVSPYLKNGTLYEYAPRLPQKSRISLISDVVHGLEYFHKLDFCIHCLRPDIILVSDEGRALVTDDIVAPILTCTTAAKAIRSLASRTFRFQAPEFAETQEDGFKTDIWSFGCLSYEVLSGKPPYHQYVERFEIESAWDRGEFPKRPNTTDDDIEMIEDQVWELIMGCCKFNPDDRLTILEIQKLIPNLSTSGMRQDAQTLPGAAVMTLRKRPEIDWNRVKQLLGQVELLRIPLSKLVQNRLKDVAAEAVKQDANDVQTLVDFLDLTLKNHLTILDERNRVLALLSRITTSSQVFPQRHEMKGIKYDLKPFAEGGFGKVYRGSSDPALCVKVTTRVNDPRALVAYIKELVLWAHSSHQNVLPFYGVFIDDSQQICLVSPYMEKGNLSNYACRLPQKSRVPLLLDTIKGLDYLHGLGIVHTDLKGENVLISDDGRGLLTDFGASHVVTATAKGAHTSATVASTLRFTAPEMIRNETKSVRPTKECDIWSFGCLCYQVLSRKLPYYEYQLDSQVFGALLRGQLPRQPGLKNDTDDDSDNEWDDVEEKDWDDLDDTIWGLILKCLIPKPEERPSASQTQELIVDMKAWDSRPAAKSMPGADILRQKSTIEVNLNRVGTLLQHLQVLLLVRSIFKYTAQEVVAAVAKLDKNDSGNLTGFWASALEKHVSSCDDRRCLLAISSAVIASQQRFQPGYLLETRPAHHPKVIAEGSFGKVYRGSELKICVKVTHDWRMHPSLEEQWDAALAPWAHSSHPNILPFYGSFLGDGGEYLVSPYIENGNLQNFAPRLPQKSRMLLVSDVIEGLTYLHKLGIIHSNLKTQNVLISDEGRGLITDFRPYHASVATAADGPTGPFITSTLRFTAPELVKSSQMLPTPASDVWSVGCLIYEVLSRKVPYYEYNEDSEIRSALASNELPMQPISGAGDADKIDDDAWVLITQCCELEPGSRPELADILIWLGNMGLEDNRPAARPLPGAEILKQRKPWRDIDVIRVGESLERLKAHLPQLSPEGGKEDEDRN